MKRIYLDHTATTPIREEVVQAMMPFFSDQFANPSSAHSYGREAKAALEQSRTAIARAIGAQSGEVFFTSGGTESNNLAILGILTAAKASGRNHAITSAAEHHAVLDPCEHLSTLGAMVTVLHVNRYGVVRIEDLERALTPQTALVTIMHSNNEVGSISPIREIARAAHAAGAIVHSDAVQSLGKVPLDVNELGVDLLSLSGHKLYGPKGIGALFIRKGTDLEPVFRGGGQERGKRPGTENVPFAVGFAKAVELAVQSMDSESARLASLRDQLETGIRSRFPEVVFNGDPENRLPHVLNISFDSSKLPLQGEMLLMNMDLKGIAVTSGSACTSGSMQPSHALLAMGRDKATAKATLRFSFGRDNTTEDVSYVLDVLGEVLVMMQKQA